MTEVLFIGSRHRYTCVFLYFQMRDQFQPYQRPHAPVYRNIDAPINKSKEHNAAKLIIYKESDTLGEKSKEIIITNNVEIVNYDSITPKIHKHKETNIPEVTIVTAYINIGSFPKGGRGTHMRAPTFYKELMTAYKNIHNPVVAFFDQGDPIAEEFIRIRQNLSVNTTVIQIDRDDFWSFRIKDNVTKIFSREEYPKHYPNTVIPEYACVTTAKFEFIQYVIQHSLYSTEYISWLDFGYWRWTISENSHFYLPPNFNEDMVAFGGVGPLYNTDYKSIIYQNKNWVTASVFLGVASSMKEFVEAYLENTNYFLSQGYMGAEQQLLYGMMNCDQVPRRMPPIQTYSHMGGRDFPSKWQYMGWLCLQ